MHKLVHWPKSVAAPRCTAHVPPLLLRQFRDPGRERTRHVALPLVCACHQRPSIFTSLTDDAIRATMQNVPHRPRDVVHVSLPAFLCFCIKPPNGGREDKVESRPRTGVELPNSPTSGRLSPVVAIRPYGVHRQAPRRVSAVRHHASLSTNFIAVRIWLVGEACGSSPRAAPWLLRVQASARIAIVQRAPSDCGCPSLASPSGVPRLQWPKAQCSAAIPALAKRAPGRRPFLRLASPATRQRPSAFAEAHPTVIMYPLCIRHA
ncbi:hypothetical protein BD413DRAFT_562959 [Trametes elegans]|nr:hypothetical protein BD413DRAFT_562959 [Trametes elegans]